MCPRQRTLSRYEARKSETRMQEGDKEQGVKEESGNNGRGRESEKH